ncbi:multicomponent Na+:H+ antiporter subunit E [Friedmanniella endophytica]|uniref:Multicomponent Na+:H+ antiporter subunit E n=1 Tax=Microlunatus kandeliicorticis TaxID=1759536 RepID=A0A7W3IVE4_9ACTN|nr:Na+/H+ antiporter subunit E [Microlunatus kandeliicorticis]MBA8795998.1 multicomponent Na+:H+ antiporter subunit E [Microlunatus kandeliicorticis]
MSAARLRARRPQPSLVIVCALTWVLLWGSLSVANLIVGALLGVVIGLVFPMPVIDTPGRLRPLGVAAAAGRLLVDLVRSSGAVLVTVLRFGRTPRNAVVRVQLRSRSDLYLAQTAELVTLVPGSLVIEARRSSSTLYLHVMDVRSDADLERTRADVLAAEERVIRAFGSAAEVAALREGRPLPLPPDVPADVPAAVPAAVRGDEPAGEAR